MEVEIRSKESIKPSSPTPHHLRDHKLSFLDLYLPPVYVPIIFYYHLDQSVNLFSSRNIDSFVSRRLQLLKESLSETLSLYYPFAGKIKDLHSVDCNDEGAYFAEARVKTSTPLSQFLSNLDISLIRQFLPEDARWCTEPIPGNFLFGVQVTRFPCGGIVLGVLVSHMVGDGVSFSLLLKSWAATFRWKSSKSKEDPASLLASSPKFDGPSLFPQNGRFPREACLSPLVGGSSTKQGKCVTRRFVFDASAIAKLKAKAETSSSLQNPTRVEAVTSLLCKSIISALKATAEYSADEKPYVISHAVNLRRRATTPTFWENQIGNLVWMASAVCENEAAAAAETLDSILWELRESMAKIDGDFVNGLLLQGDDGSKGLLKFLEETKNESETSAGAADRIAFSSWCNLGFYDLDFGWGKPAWVSIFDFAEWLCGLLNVIVLMDTKLGNGVEAWVLLLEDAMAKLQVDAELLQFATLDPNHDD